MTRIPGGSRSRSSFLHCSSTGGVFPRGAPPPSAWRRSRPLLGGGCAPDHEGRVAPSAAALFAVGQPRAAVLALPIGLAPVVCVVHVGNTSKCCHRRQGSSTQVLPIETPRVSRPGTASASCRR